MVNNQRAQLDRTFAALADPTRRAILASLAQGEQTPGKLTLPVAMSKPALSKHLRVLERAGLMQREICGRCHNLKLISGPLQEAQQWIESYRRFWRDQLDSLEHYLEETHPNEEQPKPDIPRFDQPKT